MNLLASALYDPAAAVSKSTASLIAMTALDTTNLRLAITVPSHGKVRFRLRCVVTGATTCPTILLGVLNGATVVGRVVPMFGPFTANLATQDFPMEVDFIATGLAAGAMNVDAAYGVEVVVAATNIKYGGPNDTTTNNAWGAFVFEAWDPQPNPTNFGLLSIDASGRIDVVKIGGTAQTAGDIFARLGAPAGASVSADVAAVKADTGAVKASQVLATGTATAGGAATITLQTALGADTLPVGCIIAITGGTGIGQARVITGYVNATKVTTVGHNWTTNPDATSVYYIVFNDTAKIDSSLKIAGVVLTDTVTTYTGNTVQTGDSFARIGAAGAGLTALGDTRVANLDATISSRTKPADTQAAVTLVTTTTNLTTNNDKTGYALSTAGILAIWHQLTSAIVTAGTIGKLIVDYLDAAISSRSTFAGGAVASVTGNVGGNVTGSVGSVTGNVGGNVAGSVASVTAGVTVTTNNDKTGYSLSAAAVQAIWDALTSALTTAGSIGKKLADWTIGTAQTGDVYARLGAPAGASVSADVAAVKADSAAIKLKTDNLPASPAAVGSAMTLTSGERTSIANEVETQIIDETDSEKVLTAITDKIAAVNPSLGSLTVAAIAAGVRTNLTTELGYIDVAISSRGTGAALDAAGVRSAVGLGSANLDTQLTAIDDYLDTEVAAIKTKTDQLTFTTANQVDSNVIVKTGFSLSAAGVQAIWDALTTALTTANSIGKKLADWVIGTTQTGDSYARLGAPTGASISADIAAVQSDTDNMQTRLPAALTADGNMKSDALRVGGTVQTAGDIPAMITVVDDYVDTEVAAIKTDTAAIKLKTDLIPAAPAAVGDISGLNNLSQADIRTAVGLGSANLDTQIDALPTNAEMATAFASADDVTLAAIGGLNNLSSAAALAAAASALATYDPPTRTEATADKDEICLGMGDIPTNAELATALEPIGNLPTAEDLAAALAPVAGLKVVNGWLGN